MSEGHREFISAGREGGNDIITDSFKEERDSGNFLLFQTY